MKKSPWLFLPPLALLSFQVAWSCSCRLATLQELYDRAESVITARITGCAVGEPDDRGSCPGRQWRYEAIERFKGSITSGTLGGMTSCDIGGSPGAIYLLFVPKDGRPGHCSSAPVDGNGRRSSQFLSVLREYRDEIFADLSERWEFADDGRSCAIRHASGEVGLSFSYVYDGAQLLPDDLWDGGEKIHSPLPVFSIYLLQRNVVGPTSLQVAGIESPLSRQTVAIDLPGTARQVTLNRELIVGEPVMELLDRMAAAAVEVVFSGQSDFGERVPESALTRDPVPFRVQTRTTRLADAAARFNACVRSPSRVSHCFNPQRGAEDPRRPLPFCLPVPQR